MISAHINYDSDGKERSATVVIPKESFAAFSKLVARGVNTWPDAPADIHELHDLIVNGKILQDYRGMSPKPPGREELSFEENLRLDKWGSAESGCE